MRILIWTNHFVWFFHKFSKIAYSFFSSFEKKKKTGWVGCVSNLVMPEPSWRWTRVSCHRLTARKVRKITASLLSQTNIFLHWSWLRKSFDRDWIKSSLQTIRPPNLFYARANNPRRLLTTEPLISAECFLCPIILQRQKPASIPQHCLVHTFWLNKI